MESSEYLNVSLDLVNYHSGVCKVTVAEKIVKTVQKIPIKIQVVQKPINRVVKLLHEREKHHASENVSSLFTNTKFNYIILFFIIYLLLRSKRIRKWVALIYSFMIQLCYYIIKPLVERHNLFVLPFIIKFRTGDDSATTNGVNNNLVSEGDDDDDSEKEIQDKLEEITCDLPKLKRIRSVSCFAKLEYLTTKVCN